MPSATAAATKKNAGPGYFDLIKEAVVALKERSGSSRQAIDKYVAAKKGDAYMKSRLNIALRKGVETGKLVAVKGSFKLAAEEKKVKAASAEGKPKKAEKVVVGDKKKAKKAPAVAKKPTTKKAEKSEKAPAAKKAAKATVGKKEKTAKKTEGKKAAKPSKKVSTKKPTTTKKKTVKKAPAAAKKAAKKPTVKKD